jgi:maltose O-acetyltransferase
MINVINKGVVDEAVKFIGSGDVYIEEECEIRAYTIIEMDQGKIYLGKKSVLGYGCVVQCTGTINIGKGTLIGPNSSLLASSHPINNKKLIEQKLIRGTLEIEDNIWIGSNCVIDMNSKISSNSIIGCNSFVNKNIPPDEIWAGTPIKFIRHK